MEEPALADDAACWPPLSLASWRETCATLHMWTQVVGKIRLALTPLVNHWWNVPLYVTTRGLTTSMIPYGARAFELRFDFVAHRLVLETSEGMEKALVLQSQTVADFYQACMAMLTEADIGVRIWTMPVEVPNPIPFDKDQVHGTYDGERATTFFRILLSVHRVLHQFRSRFVGKVSPVHFFWGALDLAVTRFSGRTAPKHPGGAPNCGPHVMWEAYSHEVSSAGYWPGPDGEGVFYSYAYPEPPGYRDGSVSPAQAAFDEGLGEFTLPYTAVREADDPDGVLLEFLQSTYDVAADKGGWDREALERR